MYRRAAFRPGRAVGPAAVTTRRALLALVASVSLSPARLRGQPKPFQLGWLDVGSAGSVEFQAFQAGLAELGYAEGRRYVIAGRWADGQLDRLPVLAAELVQLNPDAIVARSFAAIRAMKAATTTIPIVFAAGDPVGSGFVSSLARPGGNLTGLSMNQRDLLPKRLALLKETLPAVTRVSILLNPGDPVTKLFDLDSFAETAQRLGVEISPVGANGEAELAAAFAGMARDRTEAVMVLSGAVLYDRRQRIAELAMQHRLPLASEAGEYVDAGGLMSFGIDIPDIYRRAAGYVDKILKGTPAGDLPVEQPNRYELVLGLKTARALGITIPPLILARADRIVE